MKIVHIDIIGPYTEGMGYQENYLARYHRQMGHDVYVISSCYRYENGIQVPTDCGHRMVENGICLIRLPYRKIVNDFVTRKVRLAIGLCNTLEKISPDFIMMHDLATFSVYEVRKYIKSHPEVTLIADSHSDFGNSARTWLSREILHRIFYKHTANLIAPYTKVIYGVLPARVDFLVNFYHLPSEKCELLPMGADDELAKNAAKEENRLAVREKYGIERDDFLIVTGGKFDEAKKEIITLLDVATQMKDKKIKLLVFGNFDGEMEGEAFKYIDGTKIQYLGWLSADETYPIIGASDLAAFLWGHTSLWEQTAGQGIPMIIKQLNGTQHIDQGGNVVAMKTVSKKELNGVLNKMLEDSSYYKRIKDSAYNAMRYFSYRMIAEKCLEAIKK